MSWYSVPGGVQDHPELPLIPRFCYAPGLIIKDIHVATGLRDEIDELDQLLDKLLKLPIDRATSPAAPTVLPMKPATPGLTLHQEEVAEDGEQAVLSLPSARSESSQEILRVVSPSVPSIHDVNQTYDDSLSSLPLTLTRDEKEESESKDQLEHTPEPGDSIDSEPGLVQQQTIESNRTETVVPPQQTRSSDPVPWLEDEPLPVPTTSSGPKVEIIQGPNSEIVVAADAEETTNKLPVAKRSLLFWILWTWTWLFDQSIGRWFPFFRRPNVKFLLGLVGVALIAVSIYLVWHGLYR